MDDPTPNDATSLLAAALEATADGILIVDTAGRIVRYNQQFARLWRIPDDILRTRDDDKAIGFVLEQLVDAPGFIQKVKELYADPKAESFDRLAFKDGRVFERYSRPQSLGDRIVGRVWSFRDVTDREKALAELRSQRVAKGLVRELLLGGRPGGADAEAARRAVGRRFANGIDAPDLQERLGLFASMGFGELRLRTRGPPAYVFEGNDLLERAPGSSQPTCFIALSFLEDAVARESAHAVLGTETQCQSRGDPHCLFSVAVRRA